MGLAPECGLTPDIAQAWSDTQVTQTNSDTHHFADVGK